MHLKHQLNWKKSKTPPPKNHDNNGANMTYFWSNFLNIHFWYRNTYELIMSMNSLSSLFSICILEFVLCN